MKSKGYHYMIHHWPTFFMMKELVAVRPMDGPTGQVFYLNKIHQ